MYSKYTKVLHVTFQERAALSKQCHSPPKMCRCSPQTLVLLDGSPLVELCSAVGGGSGELRAAEKS